VYLWRLHWGRSWWKLLLERIDNFYFFISTLIC